MLEAHVSLLQAAGGVQVESGLGGQPAQLPSSPGAFLGAALNAQTCPPRPGLQEGQLGLFLLEARPPCVCGPSWFSDLSPGPSVESGLSQCSEVRLPAEPILQVSLLAHHFPA